MRTLPVGLRCAFFAIALLQSWSGAALAVADGLTSARELALPAHVEDQRASHDTRAHTHDCVACRELRSAHPFPAAAQLVLTYGDARRVAARTRSIHGSRDAHALCARSPPAGLVEHGATALS